MRRVLAARGRAIVSVVIFAALALALEAGRRWDG